MKILSLPLIHYHSGGDPIPRCDSHDGRCLSGYPACHFCCCRVREAHNPDHAIAAAAVGEDDGDVAAAAARKVRLGYFESVRIGLWVLVHGGHCFLSARHALEMDRHRLW